jgi:hypothetical protein
LYLCTPVAAIFIAAVQHMAEGEKPGRKFVFIYVLFPQEQDQDSNCRLII